MDMTLAIKGLFRRWMRDIGGNEQLPGGYFQVLLYLLERLDNRLAASPPERWFEALPARGEARAYYRHIVLPLQQELGWDDLHVLTRLQAHVNELRDRWIRNLWRDVQSKRWPTQSALTWEQALFEMQWDQLRGSGRGYFSPTLSQDDAVLYFAFVEEVETIPPGQRIYGATGLPIETPTSAVELEHIRFSAILVDRFLPLTVQIDPVDPDNVQPEQRVRRKEQLQEAMHGIALPILDLFLPPNAKDALGIAPAFGDWCLLGNTASPDDEDLSIYVTDPEDGERPTTLRTGLRVLAQAPEFWQNRLRDIFSLVHIPDADFDENERDDGAPLPSPPIFPSSGQADEVEVEEHLRVEPEFADYLEFFAAVKEKSQDLSPEDQWFGSDVFTPAEQEIRERIKRDLLNAHSEAGRRALERISNAANYYEYDLAFETQAGTPVRYSEWGTGSGGESGTPPYILCGMLVANACAWFKGKGPRLRVLMLDEAFKVHDLERSNRVIEYLQRMGFQLIIAAQMDKASSILPNFTTTVSVARLAARIGNVRTWVSQIHVIGLNRDPLRALWQERRRQVAAAAEAEFRSLNPPPDQEQIALGVEG